MWSKIKKFPRAAWRKLQWLASVLWGGVQRIWAHTCQGFKKGPWWKMAFIDLPIMAGLVFLSFTLSGYFIAEAAVLILGSSLFFSAIPEDKGGTFRHFGGLILFTLAFGATLWAWFYFRELAWLIALSQVPIVTQESGQVCTEGWRRWDAEHPPKLRGQEAC